MRRPPFLPFLEGAPSFAVGLRPIPLERWLTPDWERDCLPEKRALIAGGGAEVLGEAENAAIPAREAARLVAAAVGGEAETLAEAAELVSDDLVVMQRRGGLWAATALVLCAPTFFTAAEALGKSLTALHAPVPAADPGVAARVARVFDHLTPDVILERFNWTVQAGPERHTPSIHPLLARAAALGPEATADLLHLRVERQTIRRLPATGGVLFTIRVSLDPLAEALAEPAARAAFEAAWREAPPEVRAYKRWAALDPAVAVLLQRLGAARLDADAASR